MFFTARVVGRI